MMKNIKPLFILELKKLLRTPTVILFGVGAPIVFLIFQAEMFSHTIDFNDHEISILEYAFPLYAFLSVIVLAFGNVGAGIAYTRSTGFLKKLKLASVSHLDFIIAHFLVQLVVASLTIVMMFSIATVFYDLTFAERNILLFVGLLLLTLMMCYAIGVFLANLSKDPLASQSVSLTAYFMVLLLGGVMFPLELMPHFMQKLANILPTTHGMRVLQLAWNNQSIFTNMHFLLVLISTLIFGILAVKFFKRE